MFVCMYALIKKILLLTYPWTPLPHSMCLEALESCYMIFFILSLVDYKMLKHLVYKSKWAICRGARYVNEKNSMVEKGIFWWIMGGKMLYHFEKIDFVFIYVYVCMSMW